MEWIKIEQSNFWNGTPNQTGVMRDSYLTRLKNFEQGNSFVIVTGARRAGKSFILKQYIDHLITTTTIDKNILYLNFFLRQLQPVREESVFWEVFAKWQKLCRRDQPQFLILDEVQELQSWSEIIASIFEDHNYNVKIIIAGSNSQLLAKDASTKLSGRYFSLEVFPFSYDEYCLAFDYDKKDLLSFKSFLQDSTTPEVCLLKDRETKENLLEGIIATTVQKDIIERYNPNNPLVFFKLVDFIRYNSSNEFSVVKMRDSINHLTKRDEQTSVATIENYLQYLFHVYFAYSCEVYSYRKKSVLERSTPKIYLNDFGMALFKKNFENGRILENAIYLELKKKGYKIQTYYAYKNANREVDFWAKKNSRNLFVQVTWLMGDENENSEIYQREIGNLLLVQESGEKILVSLDDRLHLPFPITHLQPHEFIDYI